MRVVDIDFDHIFLHEKSNKTCQNILIYDILCKAFMSAKAWRICFGKIDGFIDFYDGTRYLVLFGSK